MSSRSAGFLGNPIPSGFMWIQRNLMDLLLPPRKTLHATTLKAGERNQKSETKKSDNLRSSPEHVYSSGKPSHLVI
jgi:hypothetical protein